MSAWPHVDYTLDDALAERLLEIATAHDFPAAGERVTQPDSRLGHSLAGATRTCDDPAAGNTDGPASTGREPAVARLSGEGERAAAGAPSRWDSPATSYAAGASITREGLAASEAWALKTIADYGPITDEHLCRIAEAAHVTFSPSRLRTARSKLVSRGRVRKVDNEGRTSTGRRAARWAINRGEAL